MKRRAAGFTLVELVTAMAIISILTLAIASALSFSLKVSSGQGAVDQTNLLTAADAADQISDDLHVGMNFSEVTSNSVAFSVPDRTGAGSPDQVRYAWDGVSGHPLTRQFLAGLTSTLTSASAASPPITLLNGVTNFGLQYWTRQMGTAAVTDSVLASSSNVLLGSNNLYNIDANHWCSQCLTLALPSSATTYTITRIQAYIKSAGGQDGILQMRVTNAYGGYPSTTLQAQAFYESAFSSSLEYAEEKFTGVSGLTANQPICVVLGYTSGTAIVGNVQYQSALLPIVAGSYWSTSSNGGGSWSFPVNNDNLRLIIYGTVP